MRKVLIGLGFVAGLFLLVRAVMEPFVIDFADPSTYDKDWGGPSVVGVLAVHCGPGIIAAVLMVWYLRRRRKSPRA